MAKPKAGVMEVFYGDDGVTGQWTRKAMIAANEAHLNDLRAAHGDSFYPLEKERKEESRSTIKMLLPQTTLDLGRRVAMEVESIPEIAGPDIRAAVRVPSEDDEIERLARKRGRPCKFG